MKRTFSAVRRNSTGLPGLKTHEAQREGRSDFFQMLRFRLVHASKVEGTQSEFQHLKNQVARRTQSRALARRSAQKIRVHRKKNWPARHASGQAAEDNFPESRSALPISTGESSMERSTQMRKGEPPLITDSFEETDPVTNAKVSVVRQTRGVLQTESRTYTELHPGIFNTKPVRQELEEYCDHLRDKLESLGLPTDRTPRWTKIGDGEWTQHSGPVPTDITVSFALWIKRIDELAQPLTSERGAAELLFRLTQMLQLEGVDKYLWHFAQVLSAYSDFRILTRFNGLAYDAVRTRNGRKCGPTRKKQVASAVRSVVRARADAFWDGHAALRGDASNTAAAIAADVNEDLKESGLLPAAKTGLSVKTIADHIRASLRA